MVRVRIRIRNRNKVRGHQITLKDAAGRREGDQAVRQNKNNQWHSLVCTWLILCCLVLPCLVNLVPRCLILSFVILSRKEMTSNAGERKMKE